jgi:hypothetical protein
MEHRGVQHGFQKQHTRGGKMWLGVGLAYSFAGATEDDERDGSDF